MQSRKKVIGVSCAIVMILVSGGCESVSYVKSELSGTAKPEGGIIETVPMTKVYKVAQERLWNASKKALDEMGYIYEANPASRSIKTEPKQLTDTQKFMFMGAYYFAKLYVTVDAPSVTFKARFNKKSNVTMGGEDIEFPEKENELRKIFFELLDRNLGT